METIAVWLRVDGDNVIQSLSEGREKLDSSLGQVDLDFSAVRRLQPLEVKALEELVDAADKQSVNLVIRALNIDVYKVIKLVRLASRLAFV